MVKRYIQSTIAMRYSFPMTTLALIIFIFSYLAVDRKQDQFKVVVLVVAIILTVVMISYYTKRIKTSKKLKKVENIKEYDQAVMIGSCFLLENRMLCYTKKEIKETNYQDLKEMVFKEDKFDMVSFVFTDGLAITSKIASKSQAERLAAFLKRKQPSLKLTNISTSGDGALNTIESGNHK